MTTTNYANSDMTTTATLSFGEQSEALFALDRYVCSILRAQDEQGAVTSPPQFMTSLRNAASAYITLAGESVDTESWLDSFDEMYSDRIREALRG